ncbi:hypothetical protein [Dictyobacter vulcani]|uniref:hypothetical protein n=1 Tax=Dictyobacter vulcani TaxID=2607529 RepID=UPI00138690E7|nr:hypothetical protein [Dictyobacter vulcani]
MKSFAAQQNQSECQSYQSYDISTDQTKLICSVNPVMGPNTIVPAIKVKPISSGSWHTIFTAPLSSQVLARASRGQMILFTVNDVATHVAQLYRINTDGTQLKLLTSAPAAEYSFDSYGAGNNSYLPWTNVSHDGKYYAILQTTNSKDSLIIGNIHGGSATTMPVANNFQANIVGWTAA